MRRYYNEKNNYKLGLCDEDNFKKIKLLMNELNIYELYLYVVRPALEKKEIENGVPVIALKVEGKIITGKQTELMTAAGTVILNAIKYLSKIPDEIYLLLPTVLEPTLKLKKEIGNGSRLNLQEVLMALSMCSVTNSMADNAMSCLKKLKDAEAHSTYIVTGSDKTSFKNLKINLTCESEFLEDEYVK